MQAGSWLKIEFLAISVRPTRYSVRCDASCKLRNWELQGQFRIVPAKFTLYITKPDFWCGNNNLGADVGA